VKVDKDEIYQGIKERSELITFIVFVVILLQGILLTMLWWNQRYKYYKTQYNYQLQKEALTKHFNYMVKYANDVILLTDTAGTILEVNEKAVSQYGYSESELLNMNASVLRSPVQNTYSTF